MRFHGGSFGRGLAALALLFQCVRCFPSAALAAGVEDPGQGPVEMKRPNSRAAQLSAITHAGGERYYTASDRGGSVFPAHIELDPKTGRIASRARQRPVTSVRWRGGSPPAGRAPPGRARRLPRV